MYVLSTALITHRHSLPRLEDFLKVKQLSTQYIKDIFLYS